MLYAAPAHAPDTADSHAARSFIEMGLSESRARLAIRIDAMYSLQANQAAPPPDSRMRVPVWPSQRPWKPVVRMMEVSTDIGPGSLCMVNDAVDDGGNDVEVFRELSVAVITAGEDTGTIGVVPFVTNI